MKVKVIASLIALVCVSALMFSFNHDKEVLTEASNLSSPNVESEGPLSASTEKSVLNSVHVQPTSAKKSTTPLPTVHDFDNPNPIETYRYDTDFFDESSVVLEVPLKELTDLQPLPDIEPLMSEHATRYRGDLSVLKSLQIGEQFKMELMNKEVAATLKTSNQTKEGNLYLAFTLNNGSNFKQMTLSYSKTGIRGKVVIDGMKYHLRAVDGTVLLMSYEDYIKLHDLEDHTEKER